MTGRSPRNLGKLSRWGIAVLLATIFLADAGCTRRFFRRDADREVHAILAQKDRFPFWKIENYHVYPDVRARFYDPSNPDRPTMPPDDPAARMLGPNPQKPYHVSGVGRFEGTGYLDLLAYWDSCNRVIDDKDGLAQISFQEDDKEPAPKPREMRTIEEPHPYLLKLDQSVELGLINSREFQSKRENLYLTTLPVTLERFAFAAQFFGLEQVIRETTGTEVSGGPNSGWRYNSAHGVTKLFPSGALLLFAYANRTAINLSGSANQGITSLGTLNLDIVQPLLRGGGYAVTLEPLTQSERNLLYEIRHYARFRKQFFQYITGGGDLPAVDIGIATLGRNGISPGADALLQVSNNASPQILPSGATRLLLSTGQAAPTDGYLPTLLKSAQVVVQEDNVRRLENVLKLFEAIEEGGDISTLQVDQVKLRLLQGRSQVLTSQQDYRDTLDRFKLQLGVPTNLRLELEDAAIDPITDQLKRFEVAIADFEAASNAIDTFEKREEVSKIRFRIRELMTRSDLAKKTKVFRERAVARWQAWADLNPKDLMQKLESLRGQRRKLLDVKDKYESEGKPIPPEEQKQIETLDREIELGEMENAVRRYETEPWKQFEGEKAQVMHASRFRDVRNAVVLVLGEASNERLALIRPNWPRLPSVQVCGLDLLESDLEASYDAVSKVALDNRLDLMNARAGVVDAWRQIRVFANSLLGVLNVGYHMDSNTPPDQAKPLAFLPSRTRHQLYFNAELPLVRMAERNNYRACLIGYQRARRNLQGAEDFVVNQVRADLRALRVLAQNFQIQKQAVELAYVQVESALETFRQPPAPGSGGGNAASAAALTQQLLNAYQTLPQAQNQLIATWINYQIARQQLYLDMEMMPLDYRGVWTDEFASDGQADPQGSSQPPPAGPPAGSPVNAGPFIGGSGIGNAGVGGSLIGEPIVTNPAGNNSGNGNNRNSNERVTPERVAPAEFPAVLPQLLPPTQEEGPVQ